ncbi:hypothetical protein J4Q44_G00292570 [Coregonus suidteri]|uniref:Glutamate [NMDA] receptor epsilon subunit C-terminal domain-containing protein n=1 Tax=Coregonus suidteri TaxID=861788 RepID=A0AAN8QDI2_9TELE
MKSQRYLPRKTRPILTSLNVPVRPTSHIESDLGGARMGLGGFKPPKNGLKKTPDGSHDAPGGQRQTHCRSCLGKLSGYSGLYTVRSPQNRCDACVHLGNLYDISEDQLHAGGGGPPGAAWRRERTAWPQHSAWHMAAPPPTSTNN